MEVLQEEVKMEEKPEVVEETNKDKFGESADFRGFQSQIAGTI